MISQASRSRRGRMMRAVMKFLSMVTAKFLKNHCYREIFKIDRPTVIC